jgi:sarcosine oxidase
MRIGVIGAGVVGLSVTYELARRGHDVRCFEADAPMAARSTGDTRIFRLAHERPGLVDWAVQTRRAWDEWSAEAGDRLIGHEGHVVSGDIAAMAAAMADAGAPHRVTDEPPPVPAGRPRGPFLLDPEGGAIHAAATGRFLLSHVGHRVVRERVTELTIDGATARLATSERGDDVDSVLIAAGAGTPDLAAQVGIDVPAELHHHARFTFPLRDQSATPPCWTDRSDAWRAGFTTYGHRTDPGHWAVGALVPPELVRWDRDRTAAVEDSRRMVTEYVSEYATGLVPDPVATVYCDTSPGLGDGLAAVRVGPVLAVWGDNLFKFAPALGDVLARAAVEVSLPPELDAVRHVA